MSSMSSRGFDVAVPANCLPINFLFSNNKGASFIKSFNATSIFAAPINSRLNVMVRSPTLFESSRNGCWPFRGSQLPRGLCLYNHFFRRAAL